MRADVRSYSLNVVPSETKKHYHGLIDFSLIDALVVHVDFKFRLRNLSDGMRRPVSSGMRYAPNDRGARSAREKETGNEED